MMRPRHSVLAGAPLLIAHRGGAGLAPENTLAALRNGVETWGAEMVELDVHGSADGHCVVIHDAAVDRTTNGTGTVAGMTLDALKALDAGYRFSPDGGRTFPHRDRGVTIPTIDEVLEALPSTRIIVEVKDGRAQAPLFRAIERFDARDRIIAAGMYERDRTLFGGFDGAVSASVEAMGRFLRMHALGLGRFARLDADVVQMPETWDDRRLLTPRLVRVLAARGVPVHVWTVNDVDDMRRLLDWGVEGIITDFPDRLGHLLHERNGRPLAPGHARAGDVPPHQA